MGYLSRFCREAMSIVVASGVGAVFSEICDEQHLVDLRYGEIDVLAERHRRSGGSVFGWWGSGFPVTVRRWWDIEPTGVASCGRGLR